ncbi:hypothetical protein TNCV_1954211 [Trichonephila clavipes]|nr:hypothetical protein TNCV_1954211 [Trichonephila clavipes]
MCFRHVLRFLGDSASENLQCARAFCGHWARHPDGPRPTGVAEEQRRSRGADNDRGGRKNKRSQKDD